MMQLVHSLQVRRELLALKSRRPHCAVQAVGIIEEVRRNPAMNDGPPLPRDEWPLNAVRRNLRPPCTGRLVYRWSRSTQVIELLAYYEPPRM